MEDQTTIDLWAEYKKGKEYLNVENIDYADFSFFSEDDKLQINLAIVELKLLIPQKFPMSSDQLVLINRKLDYLVESSNRVSKTDWKGIFITTVLGMIIALSLDTEKGRQLWELFLNAFKLIRLLPEQ
jgi:hypothetical protein